MTEANEQAVRYAVDGGIATITLNRPEARNALNLAMCEGLQAAASAAAANPEVRVVLVRAAGSVFCAGADLKERKTMDESQVLARRMRGFFAYEALESLPMPVIAVIEGAAAGSGVEITAACDFAVATPDATFWTPEAQWGTVGATQRLSRIVGKRLAKDMMFTGRRLTAAEALEVGLVTRIVARDALEAEVGQMAATIAKAPPLGMRLAKRCIDRGIELGPRGALAEELLAIEENLARSDWRSGIGAFGETK
ncbi:enoyl-CoA hydratase [Cupriavidus sp. YR651]|uniref:enoyl-CoA hydratase/isomerase family protein n=1 Tax=Cupriavidus sp. YR651 TaxID=1855315 RepID=UPI00088A58EB|nr:enoyl-CoA hydratase/isomerase family protein [Cupriavidus sp. YR651]SDC97373.1 enoyl-CoA hydratase [Cupriavidus sp. YR651]